MAATVLGALVAWVQGMMPSTIMSLQATGAKIERIRTHWPMPPQLDLLEHRDAAGDGISPLSHQRRRRGSNAKKKYPGNRHPGKSSQNRHQDAPA